MVSDGIFWQPECRFKSLVREGHGGGLPPITRERQHEDLFFAALSVVNGHYLAVNQLLEPCDGYAPASGY